MALTRHSRHTVIERLRQERAFAVTLLEEAQTAFVQGKPALARLLLRDLVHGTIGCEGLAAEMQTPSTSLHRMLSARGNPCMDHLSMIFDVLRKQIAQGSSRQRGRFPRRHDGNGRGDMPLSSPTAIKASPRSSFSRE